MISLNTNTIDTNPSGSCDIIPIAKVDTAMQLKHGYFPLSFLVIRTSLISIYKYQLRCYKKQFKKTGHVTCNVTSIDASLCNHCCNGEAIRITYSEPVFVVLDIQHAMHMRHIFICGLHGPTIFLLIVL